MFPKILAKKTAVFTICQIERENGIYTEVRDLNGNLELERLESTTSAGEPIPTMTDFWLRLAEAFERINSLQNDGRVTAERLNLLIEQSQHKTNAELNAAYESQRAAWREKHPQLEITPSTPDPMPVDLNEQLIAPEYVQKVNENSTLLANHLKPVCPPDSVTFQTNCPDSIDVSNTIVRL